MLLSNIEYHCSLTIILILKKDIEFVNIKINN